MYDLVKYLIPFLDKFSFWISLALFLFWIFQITSKKYMRYLEVKAQYHFEKRYKDIFFRNVQNPDHLVTIKSGWLDLYNEFMNRRANTLLLSFIFAYISFNTSAYFRSSDDAFFKLLTISTTLFLAGITYIRQQYRG